MFRHATLQRQRSLFAGCFWILGSLVIFAALNHAQETRRSATYELQPLIKGLTSDDPAAVRDSAFRLSQLKPAARALLPTQASTVLLHLTRVIDSTYPSDTRQAAVYGLGSVTPYLRGRIRPDERKAALDALSRALEASNPDSLRAASAWATSNLLRVTDTQMPSELRNRLLDDLTNLMQSANAANAAAAAEALGAVFRNADARGAGSYRAETSLLNALTHVTDPLVQKSAIDALGTMHHVSERATHALADVLKENSNADTKIAAAAVLGELGSSADTSAPALAAALLDPNESLQVTAASSLASIGSKAARFEPVVENLGIAIQQSDNPKLQEVAAWALGRMGLAATNETEDLMEALDATAPEVRKNAAWALGEVTSMQGSGPSHDSESAVAQGQRTCEQLIDLMNRPDPEPDVQEAAASALAVIAAKAERAGAFRMIPVLLKAEDVGLRSTAPGGSLSGDPSAEQAVRIVRDSVSELRTRSFRQHFLAWLSNAWVIAIVAALVIYLVWFAILRLVVLPRRPLRILAWNDALESQAVKLPGVLTNINVPLRYVLVVGFYRFHNRVLEAWVQTHCPAARESFTSRPPCKERSIWVPLPISLEGNVLPELTATDLSTRLNRNCWTIRVLGEGGSGKTALACQLAIWAMHENPEKRLARDLMVPVLLGPNAGANIRKDLNALTDAIRRELQVTVGASDPITKELIERLLRDKRILVILDGTSEMPHDDAAAAEGWESVNHPDFPVNALIVTSRVAESFTHGFNLDVAPLRIDADHLLPVMNAYLRKAGLYLDDITLFESCRRLAAMVGVNRGITPLMARLYAQHLISATPFADQAVRQFPRNLPDLVLAYLNALNQKRLPEGPDNPTLHRFAKIAAWECLRSELRPMSALISEVIAVFEKDGFGRRELEFLQHSVGLIDVIEPEEKEIYFVLDSLADYLGAMRAAELCQSEEDWRALLTRCKAASGFPQAVRGFLLALEDYCLSRQGVLRIPHFAMSDIAEMTILCKEPASESSGQVRMAAARA